MKLKELFGNVKKLCKNIFKNFPITMITIFIGTIFMSIFIDLNNIDKTLIKSIILFLLFFGSGTFFTESFFSKKSLSKIISYICFFLLGILLTYLNIKTKGFTIIDRISITYVIVLIISALYEIYERSNLSPSEYLIKVFSNVFIVTIIYNIITTGIILVSGVFIYLILSNDNYDSIWRVELLSFGLLYLPSILISLTNTKKEILQPIKIIVKNILLTIITIAFIIIYIYMLKIVILWKIPSNQVYRILSVLFIFSVPIWTMVNYYNKEKDIFQKINNILPYAFIPFIILQIYSITIRIISSGFTPFRYIGVLLILLEIIYFIIYIRKTKLSNILLIINAFIIISLLLPGINMFDVSNNSQLNRIKKYVNKDNLSQKERNIIYSSYDYLSETKEGKELIDNSFNKQEKTKLKAIYQEKYNISTYDHIYGSINDSEINIEGYNTLSRFDISSEGEIVSEVSINGETYNLGDITSSFIEANKVNDFEEHFKNYHEFEVNESTKIIFINFEIEYNQDNNKVIYYSFKGYVLKR